MVREIIPYLFSHRHSHLSWNIELSWGWLFLIMVATILVLSLLLALIVGGLALYRLRKIKIQKHYDALEIPDFVSKPRPTLEGILADKSIQQLPWEELTMGQPIGRGASGLVHRGVWEHGRVKRDVAIKELLLTSSEIMHAEALEDFLIEITYMHALRHENVVDFIGIALPPGEELNLYLVTELMQYGSVRDVLDKKGSNLPFSLRLRLTLDAAKGVEHLHKKKLIHRDLKPQNLLVNKGWVCKVSDFGVSTVRPTITRTMTCIGTPVYMAPEVLSKNKYSEKADVYSFGVLLYELFTGYIPYSRPPYDTMNQAQLMLVILEESARPSLDGMHPALAQLIQDCWNTDASLRPAMPELIVRLRRLKGQLDAEMPQQPLDDFYVVPDQLEEEEFNAMQQRMESNSQTNTGELELSGLTDGSDEFEQYFSDRSRTSTQQSPPRSSIKQWLKKKQKYTA